MALGDLTDQYKSIWYGGSYIVMWFQAGDGTMRPGMVAGEDDADEVKVAATTPVAPLGVVNEKPTLDLNTAIGTGIEIEIFPVGQAAKLSVAHDTQTEAAAKAQKFKTSETTAGCIEAWAYTDAAEKTDSLSHVVGMSLVTLAAAADVFVLLLV